MIRIKKIICIIVAYLPLTSTFRRLIYSMFPGYEIANDVKCRYGAVINVDRLKIGNGSAIGRFVKINSISKFEIGEDSLIDNNVRIFGPSKYLWGHVDPSVIMGDNVAIMANWIIDVCGEIEIGNNVLFAGQYGQIWTHTFDLNNNRLDYNLVIGNNIYIGSGCIICGDVKICDEVVVSAGSTISKPIEESGMYSSGNEMMKIGRIHDFRELYSDGIEINKKVIRAKQYTIFSKQI